MNPRLPALAAAMLCLGTAGADPSAIDVYTAGIRMEGDTLVRVLSVQGTAGDDGRFLRNRFDFDPSWQSVRILSVLYGFRGAVDREPPGWAMDTLSGGNGYGRSIAVALPGLLPGMEVSYTVEYRDWSPWFGNGPWLLFDPSGYPPVGSFTATIDGGGESLGFEGEGYSGDRDGGDGALTVTARGPDGILWVSGETDWKALGDLVLGPADSVLAAPVPPDLRGAVIESAAAGADPLMAAERARTLITESFVMLDNPPGCRRFAVTDLQGILDRRSATPLEAAVLMCSICRELGLRADILPVSPVEPLLPVPAGWERFLVRIGDGERSLLLEPSASLVQSGYVYAPDTLYMLDRAEGRIFLKPPDGPMDSFCRESWTMDPAEGEFSLDLDCRGYYDMVLRRRLAGLDEDRLPAALSSWIWRGGVVLVPDTVSVSDLYDLSHPASLHASGRFRTRIGAGERFVLSPRLEWDEPGGISADFTRSWFVPGDVTWPLVPGLSGDTVPGGVMVTDTSGGVRTFLMMMDGPE